MSSQIGVYPQKEVASTYNLTRLQCSSRGARYQRGNSMDHVPHPHIERRKANAAKSEVKGFNNWLAVKITNIVGTMWCAYAFTGLALVSLPDAVKGGKATLIAWIAQTFLQLVLLSIIMVGQKVAAAASDKQAKQTYEDAEAILELSDNMNRLLKQNTTLTEQINELICKTK